MKITIESYITKFDNGYTDVRLEFRDDTGEVYTKIESYDRRFERELIDRVYDNLFYEVKRAVKKKLKEYI